MKSKIKLSQCMIVKNEEKNLRRALSWGKDMMWEQIIVDTGSTDETVAIAEKLGAKVFHFQWIDDFAAAKNYAINQAQGDWIIFLDADEYFSPADAAKLPPLLNELDSSSYDAVAASWIQVSSQEDMVQSQGDKKMDWLSTVREDGSKSFALVGTQIRIFRNHPDIRYQGRIHEKLYRKSSLPPCADATKELAILHTGYSPEELKEKNKVERNIALVKKELEANPHNYQMLTYLGDSYFQQKNYEEAANWYHQAALYMPKDLNEDNIQGCMIFKHLLLIYFKHGNEKAALEAYHHGISRFPKDADFDYLMGHHQTDVGDYQEGARYLQRALGLLDQYNSSSSLLLSRSLLAAWDLLIICHYENGDLQQCANCAITMLRADSYRPETLKYLLLAFRRDEEREQAQMAEQNASPLAAPSPRKAASPSQVMAFLSSFYDFGNKQQRAFVQKAAQEAEYDGLLREMS